METLELDITVGRRAFDVVLTLKVSGGAMALTGPSGAGKTTVLRAIAGLVRPDTGRIVADGRVWFDSTSGTDLPPESRRVGYVSQGLALFPHLSVRDNVAFGGPGRADELLDRFGLTALARARPASLSGGERQRVALARALAREPDVLLLDEPLSALDAETKASVRADLAGVLGDARPSIVVTHDHIDAVSLAGTIGVMKEGRLLQVGSPSELVARPADRAVARFTGANVLHGTASPAGDGSTRVMLPDGNVVYSSDRADGPVDVVVHPWDITVTLGKPEGSAMNVITGPIHSIAHLGSTVRASIGPITAEMTSSSSVRMGLQTGGAATCLFKATATRLISRP